MVTDYPRNLMLLLIGTILLSGCIVLPKKDIQADTELRGCLPFPNCVSTQSSSIIHSIELFELKVPLAKAWPAIQVAVDELPNTKVVKELPFYLYAKSYSDVFRFVDYVEVLGVVGTGQLQVRSSSLLGFSDLGVNRRRTNDLRAALITSGVVIPLTP